MTLLNALLRSVRKESALLHALSVLFSVTDMSLKFALSSSSLHIHAMDAKSEELTAIFRSDCTSRNMLTTCTRTPCLIQEPAYPFPGEEFNFIAENIIPLIKKGISVPVVYEAYADRMPVSERTLYDYIDKGYFDAGNLDLRRKVRRKTNRQKSGPVLHVDKQCHVGRTYADFLAFIEAHPDASVSEMDTVEGRKGGKVILTIFLRSCSLQLMFLRDSKTAAEVTAAYFWLRGKTGSAFPKIFEVVLTDRGTEFSDPSSIEIDPETGEVLCNVFYCDPQQTNQKSRCERNHEYIRYILPKGSSFDDLTQEDVTLMMNHINSMPRASLNAKSPYQLFEKSFGKETAAQLGLKYIPLEELCLLPELLKK